MLQIREVAAAAGVDAQTLRLRLSPQRRGGCTAAMLAAVTSGNLAQRETALSDQRCPPPLRRVGSEHGNSRLRHAAADTAGASSWHAPRSDPDALPRRGWAAFISRGDQQTIGEQMAWADRCPPAILGVLARHPNPDLVSAVPGHPRCGPGLLSHLCAHEHRYVRMAVAEIPNCPPPVLRKLSGDDATMVREAAAANENCPPDVLQRLAADVAPVVREAAANNPNCP